MFSLFEELYDVCAIPPARKTTRETDFKNTPTEYLLRIEVPGYQENELTITADGKYLTVSGKQETENYFRRGKDSFTLTYLIPDDVQVDSITASQQLGILVVQMPKQVPTTKVKSIPIQTETPKSLAPPAE